MIPSSDILSFISLTGCPASDMAEVKSSSDMLDSSIARHSSSNSSSGAFRIARSPAIPVLPARAAASAACWMFFAPALAISASLSCLSLNSFSSSSFALFNSFRLSSWDSLSDLSCSSCESFKASSWLSCDSFSACS